MNQCRGLEHSQLSVGQLIRLERLIINFPCQIYILCRYWAGSSTLTLTELCTRMQCGVALWRAFLCISLILFTPRTFLPARAFTISLTILIGSPTSHVQHWNSCPSSASDPTLSTCTIGQWLWWYVMIPLLLFDLGFQAVKL